MGEGVKGRAQVAGKQHWQPVAEGGERRAGEFEFE